VACSCAESFQKVATLDWAGREHNIERMRSRRADTFAEERVRLNRRLIVTRTCLHGYVVSHNVISIMTIMMGVTA